MSDLATDNVIGSKQNIFLSDIPNEDLIAYLKLLLGNLTQDIEVWIEHRTTKGATNVKVGAGYKLPVIAPKAKTESETVVSHVPVPVPAPAPSVQQYAVQPVPASPEQYGLHGAQLMGVMLKAERLEDLKVAHAELKEDYKDLKQENRNLDNENRELKTKLSTAEAQKELAVMIVQKETKSFFDSEAISKLMDKAPELIGAFAGMKGGGAAEMATGLASANVSEVKQSFMQIVANNCSDEQVNYLGSIVYYMKNEDFINNLNALINSHAGQH
ncbi:hypothetical protein FLJC2902T_17490 [Flavobacterium limnosediminis JC2902]|uniref:Uncharacterized protein n=2 Tax=Flavobacterium TaxID=237 RepID=V6SNX0_9FLAO|nr:hypothetical protein FLJC2902T_17490 [Flavobacterium limnosediminis JC2902]